MNAIIDKFEHALEKIILKTQLNMDVKKLALVLTLILLVIVLLTHKSLLVICLCAYFFGLRPNEEEEIDD